MRDIVPLENNEIGSSRPMSMARLCLWIGSEIMELIEMKQGTVQPDFLKSAALRDFTTFDVGRLTEDEAFGKFVEIRYGDYNQVVCPHCGSIDRHYFRKNRKQWRCKYCDGYFSVTTGTPFEDHKLSFQKMLFGIMLYISGANGIASHRLARDMDVSVKTAHAFMGKIRESLYGIFKLMSRRRSWAGSNAIKAEAKPICAGLRIGESL